MPHISLCPRGRDRCLAYVARDALAGENPHVMSISVRDGTDTRIFRASLTLHVGSINRSYF
jgi:hypothetical protein